MILLNIFLGMPGPGSMVIIGIAILLLFGGKKIPELMKGLGKGVKEFKGAANGESDDNKPEESDDSKKTES